MRRLELDQLAQQPVVFGVGNRGIVEDVVAIIRVLDPLAERPGAALHG